MTKTSFIPCKKTIRRINWKNHFCDWISDNIPLWVRTNVLVWLGILWDAYSTKLLLDLLDSTDAFSCKFCHIPDGIALLQKGNGILVFFFLFVDRFRWTRLALQFAALGYILLPAWLQTEGDILALQLRTDGERCQHDRNKEWRLFVITNQVELFLLDIEVNATIKQFLDRGKHLKRITNIFWTHGLPECSCYEIALLVIT